MKRYDRSEELLLEFGTSFPPNPRHGQLFRRTDLANASFQYDASAGEWRAIQFDPKLTVPAQTTSSLTEKPTSRGEIKALANQVAGTSSPSQQFLRSGSKPLFDMGGGLFVNPDNLVSRVDPEQEDFTDGKYTPVEDPSGYSSPVLSLKDAAFDADGKFIKTYPCPKIKTTIMGMYAEGVVTNLTPYNNCDCGAAGLCPTIPTLDVATRTEDDTIPEDCYEITWTPPAGNRETLWAYHLEAVHSPSNFADADTALWTGIVAPVEGKPRQLAIVTGTCSDGNPLTSNKYALKCLFLYDDNTSCQKMLVISSHNVMKFFIDQALNTELWGNTIQAYIVEARWDYMVWTHDYVLMDESGNSLADRNAGSYTYRWYTNLNNVKFRICAYTWWGQGPFTYPTNTDYKDKYTPTITDASSKAKEGSGGYWFETVENYLNTVVVEISGDLGNWDVQGYEVAYAVAPDPPVDSSSVEKRIEEGSAYMLWSENGWFNFSTITSGYLYLGARVELGGVYSDWIAYLDEEVFVSLSEVGAAPVVELSGYALVDHEHCAEISQYIIEITGTTPTSFDVPYTTLVSGSVVSLNGLLLTEGADHDFTVTANTLSINELITLVSGDIITLTYQVGCGGGGCGDGGDGGDADTLEGYPAAYFAPSGHTHDAYAALVHTHFEYSPTGHTHFEYSPTGHVHVEYAEVVHSHPEYSPSGHTHADIDASSLGGIAATGFALLEHTHEGVDIISSVPSADTLEGYGAAYFATSGHTHDGYAAVVHIHLEYAPSGHTHTDIDAVSLEGYTAEYFATSGHTHVDINAVTLEGTPASGFATYDHVHPNYDRNTLILLPFTGADGQTRNILDSSLYAHTVIVQGNAQLDTAQYKYGSSSLLLDGSGDGIYVPQHSKFQFGYNDFTIETWVRLNTDVSTGVADARWICASGRLENYLGTWCYGYGYNVGWGAGKRMNFTVRDWAGTYSTANSDALTLTTGVWYHMACVRKDGVIKFYLDGTCVNGAGTARAELLFDKGYGIDRWVTIGARGNLSNACFECQNGWMQDFRLSTVARYTTDFTPPTDFLTPYL